MLGCGVPQKETGGGVNIARMDGNDFVHHWELTFITDVCSSQRWKMSWRDESVFPKFGEKSVDRIKNSPWLFFHISSTSLKVGPKHLYHPLAIGCNKGISPASHHSFKQDFITQSYNELNHSSIHLVLTVSPIQGHEVLPVDGHHFSLPVIALPC